MNTRATLQEGAPPPTMRSGHTLLELLLVIAILGILMMLTLPVMHKAQVRAKRSACMSQLHQVGIAAHDFAHDHQDLFPHQVSTNAGGTREFAHAGFAMSGEFYFAYRHFQALSNSLDTPKILRCPADHARQKADTFGDLRNQNVSYFAGIGADYTLPYSWLSGDGDINAESLAGGAIMRLTTNVPPNWATDCHEERGNLLFADGHVESLTTPRLTVAASATGQQVAYLLPPYLPPPSNYAPPAEETPVQALEQYFSLQSGGAAPASGGGNASYSGRSATAQAKPDATKPAGAPAAPATPAAPKPKLANAAPAIVTNAPAVAAAIQPKPPTAPVNGARAGIQASSVDESDDAGTPATVIGFVTRPERHPVWWMLMLLVAMAVAFALGWRVHRERTRRRTLLPTVHPRPV